MDTFWEFRSANCKISASFRAGTGSGARVHGNSQTKISAKTRKVRINEHFLHFFLVVLLGCSERFSKVASREEATHTIGRNKNDL
jgi:hypothetical protein